MVVRRRSIGTLVLIDRAHLDRQTLGDRRLAVEVLGLFRDQVAPLAAKPDEPRDGLLHSVRGAALGIGAAALAAAAAAAERITDEPSWLRFQAVLDETLAEIERILAEATGGDV